MKIDSEIRVALERAIEANSNRYQFSLKVGIPQQTIAGGSAAGPPPSPTTRGTGCIPT